MGIQYYIALLLSVIIYYLFRRPLLQLDLTVKILLKEIMVLIQEVFMIQEWGIYRGIAEFNGVAWYISALFACSILMFLVYKFCNNYGLIYTLVGFAAIVLLIVYVGNLHVHYFVNGHISLSIIRGLAGMTVGAMTYKVKEHVPKCFGYCSLALFFVLVFACNDNFIDFLVYPCSFAVILLCNSPQCLECTKMRLDIRRLSVAIYLNHMAVIYTFIYFDVVYTLPVFLICVLVLSTVMIIVEKIIYLHIHN